MIKSCLGCIYQDNKITSEPCNSCIYGHQTDLRNKSDNYEPDEKTAYKQKWGIPS